MWTWQKRCIQTVIAFYIYEIRFHKSNVKQKKCYKMTWIFWKNLNRLAKCYIKCISHFQSEMKFLILYVVLWHVFRSMLSHMGGLVSERRSQQLFVMWMLTAFLLHSYLRSVIPLPTDYKIQQNRLHANRRKKERNKSFSIVTNFWQ